MIKKYTCDFKTIVFTLMLIVFLCTINHSAAQVKKISSLYYWSDDINTITFYDSDTGKYLSHSDNWSFPDTEGVNGYKVNVSGWMNCKEVSNRIYNTTETNYVTGVETTTYFKKVKPIRQSVILYLQWFNSDHTAMLNKKGIHVEVFEYNDQGQNTGRLYYDMTFKPCENLNGIHHVKFKLNSNGNRIERTYFNLEDEPAVNGTGIHRTKYRYRNKNIPYKYVEHYGIKGEKAVNSKGVHKYKYNKKKRALVPYGSDGKKIEELDKK